MEPSSKPVSAENAEVPGLTLQHIEDAYQKQPDGGKKRSKPDIFNKFLILEGWTHWLFRLGFASIFLVNALYAIYEPVSFAGLLEANPVTSAIGMTDLMVKIAITNDLVLSIFIIGGWRKQIVYTWAGAWLLMVAGIKLMNLVF